MLQIGKGETVIQRIVRLIKTYDEKSEITIVTGFKRDEVENSIADCNFVYNPFYSATNSIASLWFAQGALSGDVTILNGDIVISEELFERILKISDNDVVLLDSSIKTDGDYNVQINDDHVVVMSKQLDTYHGEYAGITKLTEQSARLLREEICRMVEDGNYNEWYENALVQMILNSEFVLNFLDIAEYEWTEIDSVNHLLQARKIQAKEYRKA